NNIITTDSFDSIHITTETLKTKQKKSAVRKHGDKNIDHNENCNTTCIDTGPTTKSRKNKITRSLDNGNDTLWRVINEPKNLNIPENHVNSENITVTENKTKGKITLDQLKLALNNESDTRKIRDDIYTKKNSEKNLEMHKCSRYLIIDVKVLSTIETNFFYQNNSHFLGSFYVVYMRKNLLKKNTLMENINELFLNMNNNVSLKTLLDIIRIFYDNKKITNHNFVYSYVKIFNYSDYILSKESFFSPCDYVTKQYNFNDQDFVYKFSLVDEYDSNVCNVNNDLLQKNQHTLNTYRWPECIAISIIRNNSKEKRSYPLDIFKNLVIDNLKAIYDSKFIKRYVKYTLNAFIHINQKVSSNSGDYVSYLKASRKWYTYNTHEQKIDVMEKQDVCDLFKQNTVVTMLFYEKNRYC
ncbi:hypothetical protein COBT_002727, partial [Conglomerata obtusa]